MNLAKMYHTRNSPVLTCHHICRQAKADLVPTVAYSDSFGEAGGSGTVPYYLASAFDQIYIHDTGMLSFTGLCPGLCLL